jgi:hypothetical protein
VLGEWTGERCDAESAASASCRRAVAQSARWDTRCGERPGVQSTTTKRESAADAPGS